MFNVSVAVGLVWVLGITQPYTNVTQISFTSGQGAKNGSYKGQPSLNTKCLKFTEL